MTRLLAILIALAFVLGYLAGKRTVRPCPEPVPTEDERWQKRIDSLDSFYAEEKAIDRMKRK